ncbi:MAG: uracil-DNA glycosylase family protein [Chloroflexota bacterium]
MNPEDVLKEIAQEVSTCQKCALHFSRKRAVPGEGPTDAEIFFIGEGPGFYENESGRPFVGAAGKFLDELLQGIGMQREQVFIGNVVKCRPPGNRDPQPEEIAACGAYLEHQLAVINPKVVVTLGRYSMARFMPNAKISSVHGQAFQVNGRLIVPMFHPAAALHQPSLRPQVEQDFSGLPELIARAAAAPFPALRPAATGLQPLSMFDPTNQSTEGDAEEAAREANPKVEPKQLSLF